MSSLSIGAATLLLDQSSQPCPFPELLKWASGPLVDSAGAFGGRQWVFKPCKAFLAFFKS